MYILGILTTIIFDFVKESEERPYYFIKTNSINGGTIVDLKIGNAGNKALKFTEIISKPAFLLENNLRLNIDTFYISNSSREDLKSVFYLQKDKLNNININLKDEALERNDFVIIRIIHKDYSTQKNWKMISRIVGHKDGINNYTNLFSKTDNLKTFLFLWGFVIFLIIFRLVFFFFYKKDVVFRFWELIFLIMIFALGGFYLYIYFSITHHVM